MVLSWKENLPTELKEKVDKVDKMIEPRVLMSKYSITNNVFWIYLESIVLEKKI